MSIFFKNQILRTALTLFFLELFFSATPTHALDWKSISWRTGQVLGISLSEHSPASLLFELSTQSRLGHIGVILRENDEVWVVEATKPHIKKTKLKDYLAYAESLGGLPLAVLGEPIGITDRHRQALAQLMHDYVARKIPYNDSMYRDTRSMNCSELVFDLFERVGLRFDDAIHLQTRLTRPTPLMKRLLKLSGVSVKFPKNAEFISPASIFRSRHLQPLQMDYEMIPLSDTEILKDWQGSTGASILKKYFKIEISDYLHPADCQRSLRLLMASASPTEIVF